MSCSFKVKGVLSSVKLGTIIFGDILDGKLRTKDLAVISNTFKYEVIGIEQTDGTDQDGNHKSYVGLRLGEINQEETEKLKKLLYDGLKIKIKKNKA